MFFFKKNKKNLLRVVEDLEKKYKNDERNYINRYVNALVIADSHGHLSISEVIDVLNSDKIDMVLLLGDNDRSDMEKILDLIPMDIPIYGVLGNHDSKTFYDEINQRYDNRIYDITNKTVRTHSYNLVIGGLSGCIKYKDTDYYSMYSEAEYERFLLSMGNNCDIFVSHTPPELPKDSLLYKDIDKDESHYGIQALSKYFMRTRPRYALYGHYHIRRKDYLISSTNLIGCYGVQKITFNFPIYREDINRKE